MNLKTARIKFWIFTFLPVVFIIAAAEVALRVADYPPEPRMDSTFRLHASITENPMLIGDDELIWRGKPGFIGDGFALNKKGYRDPTPDFQKDDSKLTMAFLGDSVTFGYGIARKSYVDFLRDTWPNNPAAQIFNFSVPGFTSTQGRILFDLEVEKLAPDIVFICYLWNDSYPDAPRWLPPFGSARRIRLIYLSRYIKYKIMLSDHDTKKSTYTTDPALYKKNLEYMVEQIKSSGAKPIFILHTYDPNPLGKFGHVVRQIDSKAYDLFSGIMREVATDNGVPMLDLHDELKASIERHLPLFIMDGYHMTEVGYGLSAQLLADLLMRNNILKVSGAFRYKPNIENTYNDLAEYAMQSNAELAAYYYWRMLQFNPKSEQARKKLLALRPDLIPGDSKE